MGILCLGKIVLMYPLIHSEHAKMKMIWGNKRDINLNHHMVGMVKVGYKQQVLVRVFFSFYNL